jgi:hypothetical protein
VELLWNYLFVAYLTTVSAAKALLVSKDKTSNELERTRKKSVVAYFKGTVTAFAWRDRGNHETYNIFIQFGVPGNCSG